MRAAAFIASAFAALLVPLAASPARPPASPASVAELRAFAQEAMRDARVRGASIALLRGGEVVWLEGLGVRDERSGEPVTPATVFQAASIGKVTAAYAALLRVQDGDWRLDMPAPSHRMIVAAGCRPPTLVELLSHTSGMGNDLLAERFSPACALPAAFAYSGQGYLVLQDLFGDASGEAAEAFVGGRVFAPLGMRTATYRAPAGGDVATGHADTLYALFSAMRAGSVRAWTGALLGLACLVGLCSVAVRMLRPRSRLRAGLALALLCVVAVAATLVAAAFVIVPVPPWSERLMLPSSLHASAEDMARFAAELLEPRLASTRYRDLLLEPRAELDEALAWGAGIGIDRVEQGGERVTTYWQWASNPGFQGLFVLVPARGDAIVVLTNTGGFADVVLGRHGGHAMAKRLARRALGLNGRWDLFRAAPSPD